MPFLYNDFKNIFDKNRCAENQKVGEEAFRIGQHFLILLYVKIPQRRDNAGAVCDSDMGMLFLNRQFLLYRRLLHQKMG